MEIALLFGVLSVILSIIGNIFSLFFLNIIVFDGLAMALAAGFGANALWQLHPALCLVLGIAVLLVIILGGKTRVGFYLVSIPFSLGWAWCFGELAAEISHNDPIWRWVVFGLSLLIVFGLHYISKNDDIA